MHPSPWLAGCMGFVWEHADSFLHCVTSPFHSFVTTLRLEFGTASWGCQMLFIDVRGDAWPMLLSPCNTQPGMCIGFLLFLRLVCCLPPGQCCLQYVSSSERTSLARLAITTASSPSAVPAHREPWAKLPYLILKPTCSPSSVKGTGWLQVPHPPAWSAPCNCSLQPTSETRFRRLTRA